MSSQWRVQLSLRNGNYVNLIVEGETNLAVVRTVETALRQGKLCLSGFRTPDVLVLATQEIAYYEVSSTIPQRDYYELLEKNYPAYDEAVKRPVKTVKVV